MGLTGSFYTYTPNYSDTETEDVICTYPTDLPEDHEDYALRGTTYTLTNLVIDSVTTSSIDGVYVNIYQYTLFKDEHQGVPFDNFAIFYNVYPSKEARLNDFENPTSQAYYTLGITDDLDDNTNIRQLAYDKLKLQNGWEGMNDHQ